MPTLDNQNNIIITVSDIHSAFPEFANSQIYTDVLIENAITVAGCHISTANYGDLSFDCRAFLIELMAAHLLKLSAANGESSGAGVSGAVQSAHIGEVSVNMAIPDGMDARKMWLYSTPYGQQYLALLQSKVFPKYFPGGRRIVRL